LGRGGQEWADTDGNCCSQRTGHPSPQGICCGWSGAPQSSFRGKGVGGLTAEQREQAGGGGIRVDGCVALWGRGVGEGATGGDSGGRRVCYSVGQDGGRRGEWGHPGTQAGSPTFKRSLRGGEKPGRRQQGGGKATGGPRSGGHLCAAPLVRNQRRVPNTDGPRFSNGGSARAVGCLGAWVRGTVHG